MTLGQFVHLILDRSDVQDVFRANISPNKSHDFWFSYSHPNGLWHLEDESNSSQISELRVGLKVSNVVSPVNIRSGKFRSMPFISGSSSSTSPLQFILAKSKGGAVSGYLIDGSGIRMLLPKTLPKSD